MYNLNGIYLGLRKRADFDPETGWLGDLITESKSYKQPTTRPFNPPKASGQMGRVGRQFLTANKGVRAAQNEASRLNNIVADQNTAISGLRSKNTELAAKAQAQGVKDADAIAASQRALANQTKQTNYYAGQNAKLKETNALNQQTIDRQQATINEAKARRRLDTQRRWDARNARRATERELKNTQELLNEARTSGAKYKNYALDLTDQLAGNQPRINDLTNRVGDLESRNKILSKGTKSLKKQLSKAKRWGKIGAIGAGVGALGLGMGLGRSFGGRDNYYY